jgi:hypothetical protein
MVQRGGVWSDHQPYRSEPTITSSVGRLLSQVGEVLGLSLTGETPSSSRNSIVSSIKLGQGLDDYNSLLPFGSLEEVSKVTGRQTMGLKRH